MQSLFKQYEGVFGEENDTFEKTRPEKQANKAGFAIADALGQGRAKEVWVEFTKQMNAGSSIEMIHGLLVAKVRDMLASDKGSAEELGIHPFVYRKAKADAKNWDREKLQAIYDKFVLAYHNSRLGDETLDTAVEKILLAL